MKIITEKESIKLLGRKKGFFGQNMSVGAALVYYLGGNTLIDDDLASRQMELKNQMTWLHKYPKGYELEVTTLANGLYFGTRSYRIPFMSNQIQKWTIEKQDSVYEQQSKSALGKAVLGGLLFGGAGAIVGAISGTKSERIKINIIDYILTVIIKFDEVEKALILGVPNFTIKDVKIFFNINFPKTYIEPERFFVDKIESKQSFSIADEIMKFKELLDKGIISQQEFDIQKKRLLSE